MWWDICRKFFRGQGRRKKENGDQATKNKHLQKQKLTKTRTK